MGKRARALESVVSAVLSYKLPVESLSGKMSKNFEDLDVWQRSRSLAVCVCRTLQVCKDYGFRDQITRAAVSIPSNIAEGAERITRKEFTQFLGYAKGSAGELRTQLMIAADLGYITKNNAAELINESTQISKMLFGLIQSLKETSS